MRATLAAALVFLLGAGTAAAQETSRWYAGGAIAASRLTADEVQGTYPTTGGVFGVRLTRAFSVEADLTRGLRKLTRTREGTSISFAGRGASREEIERQAVHRRWQNEWAPTMNLAMLAVWRSTAPSRVRPAAYVGVTAARYKEDYSSVVTALPAVVPVPADDSNLLPQRQVINRMRGGLTGGVMFPITITGRLSVAPEVRYTYGSIGDEKHNLLRTGVRILWGF
jgi:outer membrane protein with beta-barrel domain